jgi:hypothetical protein
MDGIPNFPCSREPLAEVSCGWSSELLRLITLGPGECSAVVSDGRFRQCGWECTSACRGDNVAFFPPSIRPSANAKRRSNRWAPSPSNLGYLPCVAPRTSTWQARAHSTSDDHEALGNNTRHIPNKKPFTSGYRLGSQYTYPAHIPKQQQAGPRPQRAVPEDQELGTGIAETSRDGKIAGSEPPRRPAHRFHGDQSACLGRLTLTHTGGEQISDR